MASKSKLFFIREYFLMVCDYISHSRKKNTSEFMIRKHGIRFLFVTSRVVKYKIRISKLIFQKYVYEKQNNK